RTDGADAAIAELTLEAPVVIPPTGALQLQVAVTEPGDGGRRTVTVHSRPASDDGLAEGNAVRQPWTRHAEGVIAPAGRPAEPLPAVWPPHGATPVPVDDLYERMGALGLAYGPAFQGLHAAWRNGEELYAEVALPESVTADAEHFGVHPALL